MRSFLIQKLELTEAPTTIARTRKAGPKRATTTKPGAATEDVR